ncbi:hypothetical protein DICVIV_02717 [Dictyocaulus viviparus]|uniref:Spectrin repeat-containing domain protein n=1 Tax=Dictyocaulus viviparus TaxID=29172 RepID=A0A0D8Y992_DICVI|nr:hypothetical protein DICVIV_02717 [Dictyocaulus viviparus]
MNVLTGHDETDKETKVAKGIEQWIESCDKILSELAKVPKDERRKRLIKLQQQLQTQDKNVAFVEKDPLKKAILKKGLDIVKKRISILNEEPSTSKSEAELNSELENGWCTVGDVTSLDKEVERAEKIVELARKGQMSPELIEKAETRRAEMIERRRSTVAALEKMKAAEDGMQRFVPHSLLINSGLPIPRKIRYSIAVSVEATSSSDISIGSTIIELEHARERLTSYETLKKEAERAAEKMLALDDNVPQTILTTTRDRIRRLSDQWRDLENQIEDHLNCARKEHRRSLQKKISVEERLLEELEKRLTESEQASDAEECCEHLDNLENLLEKINTPLKMDNSSLTTMDESFVRESYARLNEARQRLADATRERIAVLSRAVADCEHFEKQMADIQQWSNTISTLLDLRKSSDISALDVPDEYKSAFESGNFVQELEKEFNSWSNTLDEIDVWLDEDERRHNRRFHDQFDHAKDSYYTRAEDAVERLEDCVATYEKLLKESEEVEEFLDELDSRLEKYAAEDTTNDEETVNELINEWNRHEASVRNLEELERLLREHAVKVSDSVCAEKRRRADALKIRLDAWSRTVQEMSNDEETLLMQVDELHGYLVNELEKIKDKDPEEVR